MGNGRLILTVGLPGCGKSYWAQQTAAFGVPATLPGLLIIERDMIRAELTGNRRDHTREMDVTRVAQARVRTALMEGYVVIVSDTNLKPRYRREWADLADECNADVQEVSFLDVPLATCIARDAERSDPVGEDVIRGMHRYLLDSGQITQ